MTDYKSIFGKPIKTLTTDPTDTGAEGQIWYNSTAAAFKSVLVGDAWVSGAPLTTSRFQGGMIGTQTSALLVGSENPTTANLGTVEEYNGAGWSSSPSVSTARQGIGSTGTTSAGLAMGGMISGPNVRQTLSEEYNGTAWTAGNALTEAGRANISGAATQTAGVAMFSGELTPDSNSGKYHEQYDGTSWTASTKCPTVRVQGSYAGDQTAGIGFGGRANSPGAPSVRNKTSDIWNGTTWTSGPSGVTERSGHSSHGTDSSAIFCRGATNPGTTILTSTEEYDGTSFSATPSVTNTGQGFEGGHAQPSSVGAAWIAGGSPVQNQTEEFNRSTSVITPGAWAAGATQPVARQDVASFGTSRSAGIMFAGGLISPGYSTSALTYDGAWTANPSLNTGRGLTQGFGTVAAGNVAGGYTGSASTASENWNGSTWTTTGSLNAARQNSTAFGTQTAGVVAGSSAAPLEGVEHFDGSAWTSATALPTPTTASYSRGCGTQTAGLWIRSATAYEYNGSAWTASNALNTPRIAGSMAGIQTSALYGTGSQVYGTEAYDGTTWRTDANVAVVATRTTSGPAGDSSSLVRASGENTPSGNYLTSVEEYNPETSALNLKTLTTS